MYSLKSDLLSCTFDDSGRLTQVSRDGSAVPFAGIRFDVGCNEKNLTGLLEYDSLLENHTWDLPKIQPVPGAYREFPVQDIRCENDTLTVSYQADLLVYSLIYAIRGDALSVTARLENTSAQPLYLNTLTLDAVIPTARDIRFDFPCNTPADICETNELDAYQAVSSGLINFAVHAQHPAWECNALFIDEVEKWGCGVYHDGESTNFVYSAHLEADLKPGQLLSCGTLYLEPVCGNPYLQIRSFVDFLGYRPVQDGVHDGIMYSCHPHGTMDSDFPLRQDLYEYAGYLDTLHDMGIDHVWLLPIFDHGNKGVYHSNDQSIIDARYGGDPATKAYVDKAHSLGMTVLFDYVPHGPVPEFPLAQEHPDWCSKRRDGSWHNEWDCVSMDYNHPGYQEYTTNLVYDHVKRFGVDGARIDCAMGGLSNWQPYGDNRPSADSVQAGVNITRAIRDGFVKGGKKPLNMPENFNPIPPYYFCTDVFYGMNLYRAFVELEPLLQSDPAAYAAKLTRWLETEKLTTPQCYAKMRFLGNHDTVAWVWQAKRATACYGIEGAKALWAVITLIDGVPMIYQGDEDPELYLSKGPKLIDFFTRLFHDRKQFIGENPYTEYLYTGTPVMAFFRGGNRDRLVLVNLANAPQTFRTDAVGAGVKLLAGAAELTRDEAVLPPYSYAIFSVDR